MKTFLDGRVTLHGGDCLDVVRGLDDNSIDSVCTDPPYALVSIVKRFGASGAAPAGGEHAGGAYARASAGFMGKQWDTGETAFSVEFWAEILRVLKPGGHVAAFGGTRSYHRLACAIEDAGFEIRDQLAWCYGTGFPKSHDVSKGIDKAAGAKREPTGEIRRASIHRNGTGEAWDAGAFASHPEDTKRVVITASATAAARQWEGWGTALKPAWEPICLARKPLGEKTVASNVLRWGCGAINIDATRIGNEGGTKTTAGDRHNKTVHAFGNGLGAQGGDIQRVDGLGRWPANLCLEDTGDVTSIFPGSAARFFYSAKASKADRALSKHPTVKPVKLMQWLVRLITPPGGVTLDPFAGTGTTGEAAWREGFSAVLIEREEEYQADIARRMLFARAKEKPEPKTATRSNDEPETLPLPLAF